MGILRFYLALCVVVSHSNTIFFSWVNHNGREAVQIFYLISGFYMAHIAHKYNSSIEFYLSRFIRIYTPYYFILFVITIVSYITGSWFNIWGRLDSFISQSGSNGTAGIVLTSISNITLFFQDWTLFFKHNIGESLSFTTKFYTDKAPLYKYLMIPQAWSVGVELTFYLFVPLLSRLKSKTLFLFFFISLVLRIFSYEYLDLKHDPWLYRFFPFELAIFILGMLSNRLYHFIKKLKVGLFALVVRTSIGYFIGICLTFMLIYASKEGTNFLIPYTGLYYAELISYLGWALSIPVLFLIFENIRYDRFIGELSYPVYLIHLTVIYYSSTIMSIYGIEVKYLGMISSLITISFAIFIYKCIIIPVDRKRYKLSTYIANNMLRYTLKKHSSRA